MIHFLAWNDGYYDLSEYWPSLLGHPVYGHTQAEQGLMFGYSRRRCGRSWRSGNCESTPQEIIPLEPGRFEKLIPAHLVGNFILLWNMKSHYCFHENPRIVPFSEPVESSLQPHACKRAYIMKCPRNLCRCIGEVAAVWAIRRHCGTFTEILYKY
jgi:hypothetical protein